MKTMAMLAVPVLLAGVFPHAHGAVSPILIAAPAEARPAPEEAIAVVGEAPVEVAQAAAPENGIWDAAGEAPKDVEASIQYTGSGKRQLQVSHKGRLVSLRDGNRRAAGMNSAAIDILNNGQDRWIWETTAPDTLETLRGVVRLDAAGPKLRLADAPREAGAEKAGLHTCRAFHDGFGGFSVLCRVDTFAAAASLGEDAGEGVFVQLGEKSMVRLDLPLGANAVESRVMGYAHGATGVVVRAEASRLPGEARPSLALLSAERAQPIVRPRPFRHRHPRRPPPLLLDLL